MMGMGIAGRRLIRQRHCLLSIIVEARYAKGREKQARVDASSPGRASPAPSFPSRRGPAWRFRPRPVGCFAAPVTAARHPQMDGHVASQPRHRCEGLASSQQQSESSASPQSHPTNLCPTTCSSSGGNLSSARLASHAPWRKALRSSIYEPSLPKVTYFMNGVNFIKQRSSFH